MRKITIISFLFMSLVYIKPILGETGIRSSGSIYFRVHKESPKRPSYLYPTSMEIDVYDQKTRKHVTHARTSMSGEVEFHGLKKDKKYLVRVGGDDSELVFNLDTSENDGVSGATPAGEHRFSIVLNSKHLHYIIPQRPTNCSNTVGENQIKNIYDTARGAGKLKSSSFLEFNGVVQEILKSKDK